MTTDISAKDKEFQERIRQIRALYQTYPDIYRVWREHQTQKLLPEKAGVIIWYGEPEAPTQTFSVQLIIGEPGTLAWKIAHYEADLPVYDKNIEIHGNVVSDGSDGNPIEFVDPPTYEDDGPEVGDDFTQELRSLPVVEFDSAIHFAKKPRFKAEINNLTACTGSPHVIQLLGRTNEKDPRADRLVFPKYARDVFIFALGNSGSFTIGFVKKMLLSLIAGVEVLHRKGIIHGDLTSRNLLMSGNRSSAEPAVIIIDLECYAASYSAAPELKFKEDETWDMSTFSSASDIYSLGVCLREFMIPCHHRSMLMGFEVPPPFKGIYEACTRELPEQRPTLEELRAMAEAVEA